MVKYRFLEVDSITKAYLSLGHGPLTQSKQKIYLFAEAFILAL